MPTKLLRERLVERLEWLNGVELVPDDATLLDKEVQIRVSHFVDEARRYFSEAFSIRAGEAEMRDGRPDDLRADGWTVAAHNDYRDSDGNGCTFWLLTKGDRCVRGEGYTDAIALNQVRSDLTGRASAAQGQG